MRLALILCAALAASPAAAQEKKQRSAAETHFSTTLAALGAYIAGLECMTKRERVEEMFLVLSIQNLAEDHFGMTKAEAGAEIEAAQKTQATYQKMNGKCIAPDAMLLWPRFLAEAFYELGKTKR